MLRLVSLFFLFISISYSGSLFAGYWEQYARIAVSKGTPDTCQEQFGPTHPANTPFRARPDGSDEHSDFYWCDRFIDDGEEPFVCPDGSNWDPDTDLCITPCPENSTPDGNGGCTCDVGYEPGPFAEDGCIAIECPDGMTHDSVSNRCLYDSCDGPDSFAGNFVAPRVYNNPDRCHGGCVISDITDPGLIVPSGVMLPWHKTRPALHYG